MKLLLDTHIWIWSAVEPERLGKRVRQALSASANEIWLSPISVWEATLLVQRGRISPGVPAGDWMRELLRVTPAKEAPLTHDVAMLSCELRLTHRDPADRFLAASAIVHNLTLVTADKRLLKSSEFPSLANR